MLQIQLVLGIDEKDMIPMLEEHVVGSRRTRQMQK